MKTRPLIAITSVLTLTGCATGERGIVSPHQPVVSAAGATVPGCPDWSDNELPIGEGQAANYGCATALNLAAMIVDPNDLVRGRTDPMTGLDPAVATSAMKSWRDVGTTGKQGVEKQSAKGN